MLWAHRPTSPPELIEGGDETVELTEEGSEPKLKLMQNGRGPPSGKI